MVLPIKSLSEKVVLYLIESLQSDLSDETTKTLNNIFKELIRENIHLEVVKLLLANDKVDPSDDDNYAIRFASEKGHLEIVKLLLANDKVDPSDNNNYAIRFASENGHLEVVKLLLANDKVDPGAGNNWAIGLASENGYVEIVKLLLANDKVDPGADNNYAIKYASTNGHLEIVKLLIPKIDMSKITDTKILDIAKEMPKVESLEESKRLILAQMRSHNMYKICIKGGTISYSYTL